MTLFLGLTGGIATGKSTASKILQDMGCQIIDTDLIAHQQAEVGQAGWLAIKKEFGDVFFKEDQTLDRKKLGQYVFNNPDALKRLSTVTQREILKEVKRQMAQSTAKVCVLDVPLLFEAGWDQYCDLTVLIDLPEAEELRRLMARDGLTAAEAEKRIKAQLPLAEKRRRASYIIENTGTIEALRKKLDQLLAEIA
ncbi:dephospho-CoA kinase [Lactobacillus equicursoris]|uniref:Dephospho-CoA kinase n=1 Tax=Lactobacillus equicursoris TaxID=420645 RepID=A0A844FNF1_9LACO|nr:dephospho-CoA kinase [Lactobacillus equicursoris]MST79783.1 dephospho-CoA kinase [Lactobacillus equicursoris]